MGGNNDLYNCGQKLAQKEVHPVLIGSLNKTQPANKFVTRSLNYRNQYRLKRSTHEPGFHCNAPTSATAPRLYVSSGQIPLAAHPPPLFGGIAADQGRKRGVRYGVRTQTLAIEYGFMPIGYGN